LIDLSQIYVAVFIDQRVDCDKIVCVPFLHLWNFILKS